MKQEFSIKGMSCNHCVARIEETLNHLEGVKKATVNLKKETGKIKFDETKIQATKICQVINELGYQAEVI
ncbi:copper-binding protein [Enterococcus villorum]|uniref:Copper chaperone CopZ n=2 Tax=Enterococcus villorum TaxID=112904 RepID=A0A1V8YIC3_9ENTE|nr:copper chaperone CopZ [Enterococcus villorum]EOH86179.1 copper chaperone CopZ [Enterococcus villorum ATCC 700913]EOW78747.1 copper chaperone CopZ [Enterococcus villorum ATCC 700913]OQO68743.1 copper-binding protein [Enterococcus villorum]OQO72298.1 copper-binding protein [Enterococcus villorum]GEL91613.1 copper-binding protein [Enterococcus villorum]